MSPLDTLKASDQTYLIIGEPPHGTQWNMCITTGSGSFRKWFGSFAIRMYPSTVCKLAEPEQWTSLGIVVARIRSDKTGKSFIVDNVEKTNLSTDDAVAYGDDRTQLFQGLNGDRTSYTYWANKTFLAVKFDRYLSDKEVKSLTDNPWQIFKPRTRRTIIDLGAGSGTNTSLTISEALHAHNVDALLLSWQDLLTVSDSNHAHTADSLTLSTQWLLAVQEALHAHAADNIGLSATGSASLSVQDSTHAHLADALTLVTTWLLSVADSKHGHAADNLTLDTSNATWLTVQESFHAHTADNVALTLDTWLAIVDAAHAHYADAQTITVDASLAVAEALHAVYSESVRLGIPGLYVRAPNGPGYRRLMINVTRPKQRNTVRH